MFDKLGNLIVSIIVNGLLVLIPAALLAFVSGIALAILNVPLSLLPDVVHHPIMGLFRFLFSFKFIFSVALICGVADDFGLPNLKTYFKKRLKKFFA